MRTVASIAAGALLAAGRVPSAYAQFSADTIVTTRHQVAVDGRVLRYTARAGRLPIIHIDGDEPHGHLFFVSYTLDRAPTEPPRPIIFVWNGGPGSSSSQVHFMGFGPRIIDLGETFPAHKPVSPASKVIDNQATWLDFADLVFVDPMGTGYSRPTKPEYMTEFWGQQNDAEVTAEFIRVFRQRFDAFNAPLFLAGESYGTVRAMLTSEALERRRTHLAGVILISGFIRVGQEQTPSMTSAWQVEEFAAAAHYHKKLPPDLQSKTVDEVERLAHEWAINTYAPALARRDSLSDAERRSIVAQLGRFAGVRTDLIDAKKLTLNGNVFADSLLASEGRVLGRYDVRMSKPRDPTPYGRSILTEASLAPVMDIMQGTSPTLIRYLQNELGYKSDLLYQGPFGEGWPAPTRSDADGINRRFNQIEAAAREGGGAASGGAGRAGGAGARGGESGGENRNAVQTPREVPALRRAMELNPSMRVVIYAGRYDALDGCGSTGYAVAAIQPPLRDRVEMQCLNGGHMSYTDRPTRVTWKTHLQTFVRRAVAASGIK